jgi:hypothetical protein
MDERQLWQAIHMLHEEAHGKIPFRTCTAEPCRLMSRDQSGYWPASDVLDGPAPASLPRVGQRR